MKKNIHLPFGKAVGTKVLTVVFLCSFITASSGAFAFKTAPLAKNKQSQLTISSYEQPLDFKMYPNPSKGDNINVEIEGIKTETLNIALYNTIGKVIFEKSLQPDGFKHRVALNIDPVEKLAPGLYFLSISSKSEKLAKKLVVTE